MGYLNILVFVIVLVFATILFLPNVGTSQHTYSSIANASNDLKAVTNSTASGSDGFSFITQTFPNLIGAASGIVKLLLGMVGAITDSIGSLAELPPQLVTFIIIVLSIMFILKVAGYLIGREGS